LELEFGRWRPVRGGLCLSVAELSRAAGVSRQVIDRYEGSSDGIGAALWRLESIAKALGVSVSQVISRGLD
jgi:transcriptional regulator with XRE-family HTH domain